MKLIIVESPTKAKTLQGFLGTRYKVLSSFGHIRDLPASELGVDTENDFKPRYVIPTKARKTITALKEAAKKADLTILATDEDREGEAISFHLKEALNLKNTQRIAFHEITKQAIEEALKNPRDIDMNLVDAQQARRILDRIVGDKLSPFLWKKISRGLSAGRVQSVTVRLVVDREREIEKFVAQEYWTIEALLHSRETGVKGKFIALLVKKDGKPLNKFDLKDKGAADEIVKDLHGAEYNVTSVEKQEVKRNPLPPFTTSTLQQEAFQKLRFPAKMTMRLGQNLYERGLITYHRTDSLNLSEQALWGAKKLIETSYGKNYWAGFPRKYKTKTKGAQEAHEAIRPTYPEKTPENIKNETELDDNQLRLYDLVWRRFIACQMRQAALDTVSVDIAAKNYLFRASGQTIKFDGFLRVYPMKLEENELPRMDVNEILELLKLTPNQHFTQPPARYTEASLIKTLEENGIGRPSTYAPIISTVQERNYIEKNEQKKFRPTEIGIAVNDLLVEHFPAIVDIKFTAQMEEELDEVAQGEKQWVPVMKEFYDPFAKLLEEKYREVSKQDIGETATDKVCPECGSPLVIRLGRYGRFYACSAFPKCRHTEPLQNTGLGIKCPKCGEGEILEKRTKTKKIFYGCSRFPKCDFALWDKPVAGRKAGTVKTCPRCRSVMVETKGGKSKCSNKVCMK